ncbi:hypothetical protein Tco_0336449 [Tanacetum coccineum]
MVRSSSSREAFEERMQLIKSRIKLEGIKFLATSTAGLSEEDAKLISKMKEEIQANINPSLDCVSFYVFVVAAVN